MAHFSGVGAFFLIVLIVAVIGGVAWIVYTHLRARRLGLPQPSLSSYNPFKGGSDRYGASGSGQGGVVGWVKDKVNGIKNRNNRSAGGAYEEPLSSNVRGRAANRGFGPLDPDDAWDARVGTEADAYGPGGYFEEQELGLHGGHSGVAGTSGTGPGFSSPPRGRSLSREPEPYVGGSKAGLDRRYDEEMGIPSANNPFDDPSELRGVSPRPMDTKKHKAQDDNHSERRSMFRENM
ncbi:uncharacterized protein EAF01_009074 [Botrytis porri]|uniref:Acid phosphatase-like protein n=1 Tax=Botrytis porri TaxID=87229 RepID=A0A4Z1KKL9_9HELO|nr:uncharacterized protein EAF01_009074 [Botrytis porri]KAF7896671.1 hypothetical protein EAF01_009074 [Botrytis porri]TGO86613.1 hypothetical protein BPOR_0289g00020 [Botrytis porri]